MTHQWGVNRKLSERRHDFILNFKVTAEEEESHLHIHVLTHMQRVMFRDIKEKIIKTAMILHQHVVLLISPQLFIHEFLKLKFIENRLLLHFCPAVIFK